MLAVAVMFNVSLFAVAVIGMRWLPLLITDITWISSIFVLKSICLVIWSVKLFANNTDPDHIACENFDLLLYGKN